MKTRNKILFVLGGLFLPVMLWASTILTFDTDLEIQFPGYAAHQSFIHFNYGGNNFEGAIFPTTGTTLTTGVDISVIGDNVTGCDMQVEGLYYNNSRGLMIRPLDTTTLSGLRNIDTGYDAMNLTGGLYYDCSSEIANEVYGQITIDLSGAIYKLTAGLEMDFGNNDYNNNFTGSLIITGDTLSGYLFDSYGGIGKVYLPPYVALTGELSFVTGTHLIKISNNFYTDQVEITLHMIMSKPADYTITGDIISQLAGASDGNTEIGATVTAGDGIKHLTGIYEIAIHSQRYDTTASISLDTTPPSATTLLTPTSGSTVDDSVNFTWNASNDTGVGLNNYTLYVLSGGSLLTGITLNTTNHTLAVHPSGSASNVLVSGNNYSFFVRSRDHLGHTRDSVHQPFSVRYTHIPDITPPTTPVITSPSSGASIAGDITLGWTNSTDAGVGLANPAYSYKIFNLSGSLIYSGTSTTTNATITYGTIATGDYQWYVQASDASGNVATSITGYFTQAKYVDITPDSFSFNRKRNARRGRTYQSNLVLVSGLGTGVEVEARVNRGVLFIDGNYEGLTGTVSNGSGVWIELISSDNYDTTRSSTMTIGTRSATFYVETETENEDDDDSNTDTDWDEIFDKSDKISVLKMFNELVEIYENKSKQKRKEFFYAWRSTIKDEITTLRYQMNHEHDFSDKYKLSRQIYLLEFLYDLTIDYLMNSLDYTHELLSSDLDENGIYYAPNGKKYVIEISSSRGNALYSKNFKTTKYFPTRSSMKSYIDINNPSGTHHYNSGTPDIIITPNGKKYHVIFDQYTLSFYSPDSISQKHFESLYDLHRWLDINNPGSQYWNHTVDPSFTTIIYQAPNGKIYSLRKTTDNRYFSPFFTQAKYFPTLQTLKDHIDVHNM